MRTDSRTASRGPLCAVILLAGLCAACAMRATSPGTVEQGKPSDTMAPSIYYEEGELVFFAVNAGLARFDADRQLVAVEIGVANKRLPKLSVDLEGITLRNETGRWPAASVEERGGHKLRAEFDRKLQLVPFDEALRQKFPSFRRLSPNTGATPEDRSLSRTVAMGPQTWLLAQVWFPHPGGRVTGEVFEVWLSAPELPDPVFTTVRF